MKPKLFTLANTPKDDIKQSFSLGSEGDGKWQSLEPLTDYNGNDIFDYPASYDSEQEIWRWDKQTGDISSVCFNCSQFIKSNRYLYIKIRTYWRKLFINFTSLFYHRFITFSKNLNT